jgi:probable addiction module antidote protein
MGVMATLSWSSWPVVRSNVRIKTSEGRNSFGMSTFRRSEMPVREHKASDYLSTPEDIAAYLNAAIEEMGDDPRLLMKAFRNVAEAQGGVSKLAAKAQLDRVALSRTLSGRRNPRLDTLAKVSAACGVKLQFSA